MPLSPSGLALETPRQRVEPLIGVSRLAFKLPLRPIG
ncbi:hypothetical protein BH23PLA1_BH23PLA1_44280 [soil metagenome]